MAQRAAPMAGSTEALAATLTDGGLGMLTLQRDRALNAFDLDMARAADGALREWMLKDSACHAVLVHAASDRAFCSGGDIKAIRQAALDNPYQDTSSPPEEHLVSRIFQEEYKLVADLAKLPKPGIALAHGIWMGFGVGLGGLLPIRIVTEKTVFAMPECSIGLLPDVAFAHMAAERMPAYLGLYLALTGARVTNASDLMATGMATHYVPSSRLAKLTEELRAHAFTPCCDADLLHTVEHHTEDFPNPSDDGLQANINVIQALMAPGIAAKGAGRSCVEALQEIADTVKDMAESDDANEAVQSFAQATHKQLSAGAPRSMALALEHVMRAYEDTKSDGPASTVGGCLSREFNATTRMAGQHDFLEGVRAAVVDKDKAPRWRPGAICEVDPRLIDELLSPLPSRVALQLGED